MKKNMGTLTHTNFWVSEKRNEKRVLDSNSGWNNTILQ
jgi:hypothetical protein